MHVLHDQRMKIYVGQVRVYECASNAYESKWRESASESSVSGRIVG